MFKKISYFFFYLIRANGIPSPTFDSKRGMNGNANRRGSLGTTSSIGNELITTPLILNHMTITLFNEF